MIISASILKERQKRKAGHLLSPQNSGLTFRFDLLKKAKRSNRNGDETSKRPSQGRACSNRSGNDPDAASNYSDRDDIRDGGFHSGSPRYGPRTAQLGG